MFDRSISIDQTSLFGNNKLLKRNRILHWMILNFKINFGPVRFRGYGWLPSFLLGIIGLVWANIVFVYSIWSTFTAKKINSWRIWSSSWNAINSGDLFGASKCKSKSRKISIDNHRNCENLWIFWWPKVLPANRPSFHRFAVLWPMHSRQLLSRIRLDHGQSWVHQVANGFPMNSYWIATIAFFDSVAICK